MTSGRKPAGTPADWQRRQPAGAPAAHQDEDQVEEQEAAERAAPAPDTGADGEFRTDNVQKSPTPPDSPPDDESAEAVEEDLAALLADVKRERDEYLELAQRARADFENYRKRAAQQASDAERKAKASLARDLIPAIDNLERALEALENPAAPGREAEEAAGVSALTDGVRLVHRELTEALDRAGVESFDPTGQKFDPSSSEALSTQPSDGSEPGTVLQVLTRGYRIGEQVIRPARVVVAASEGE
jgi:molecular chaperone GrpE